MGYAVWNEVENEWDLDRSIKNHNDMGHVDNSKILPIYLAPPSTEALQKDKAELIEYANKLLHANDHIAELEKTTTEHSEWNYKYGIDSLISNINDIPQPKCMEQK